MSYPLSFEEKARIEEFLERYSDSEEHLCLNCCAEYRSDIEECPECEEELYSVTRAREVFAEKLAGSQEESSSSCDKECDCECDPDGEEDDKPLSDEERKRIGDFLSKTDDDAEGLACIACLVVCEPGYSSCTTCGNGLLEIGEAKVALSHLLATDAAGEAPAAIAFVPAEAAEMLGSDVSVDVKDEELGGAEATDAALANEIATERLSDERRDAIVNFVDQYGDSGVEADICLECLEEFRIGIGECPQCGEELVPGEEAIKRLKDLL